MDGKHSIEIRKKIGMSKTTQEKLAVKMGLDEDATLGTIARAAREKWPKLFPELPGVRPKGTDLQILSFVSAIDPERTNTGEIPPEVQALRKALEEK